MKRALYVFLGISLVMANACSDNDSVAIEHSTYDSSRNLMLIEDDTIPYNPEDYKQPFSSNERAIADKLSQYSVDLLEQYGSDDNLIVSPVCVSLVHSMAANFEKDASENSYKKSLGLDEEMEMVNSYSRKVIDYADTYKSTDKDSAYSMSNKIWIESNLPIYRSFISVANFYKINAKGVDFNDERAVAAMGKQIDESDDSKWTSQDFLHVAKSFVSSSISFTQKWGVGFEERIGWLTFHNANGTTSDALTFISTAGMLQFYETSTFYMVQIPYNDKRFAMFLVIPKSADGFDEALEAVQVQGLSNCISKMEERYMLLGMPKLDIETDVFYGKIERVGIDRRKLYATALSNVSPAGFRLDDIYQSCRLHIDEKGTAAKAISHEMPIIIRPSVETNTPPGGEIPLTIWADVPFMMFIRENTLGTILFSSSIKKL